MLLGVVIVGSLALTKMSLGHFFFLQLSRGFLSRRARRTKRKRNITCISDVKISDTFSFILDSFRTKISDTALKHA